MDERTGTTAGTGGIGVTAGTSGGNTGSTGTTGTTSSAGTTQGGSGDDVGSNAGSTGSSGSPGSTGSTGSTSSTGSTGSTGGLPDKENEGGDNSDETADITVSAPNYFTGTANQVSVRFVGRNGWRVRHAALYLKGLFGGLDTETELRIDNDRNLPDKEEHTVWAMFDSSRFRHNSFIRVYGRVTLAKGPLTTQRRSDVIRVINWNKAALLARHEFEYLSGNSAPTLAIAGDHLLAMGHNTLSRHRGDNWTPQALMLAISDATAVHLGTHGNSVPAITDDGDQSNHQPIWHRAAQFIFAYWKPGLPSDGHFIRPHRTASIGAGSYPNNTGYPPINMGLFMACHTSGNPSNDQDNPATGVVNDFAEAILVTSSDGSVDNRYRALVGWRILTKVNAHGPATNAFWGALAQGKSVHGARLEMFEAYDLHSVQQFEYGASHYTAVHGDPYARLRQVYIESHDPSNSWYRR